MDPLLHGDVDVRMRYESACLALEREKEIASLSGRELSSWRWAKPWLEHNADYWRDQMQLTLKLEVA